MEILKENKIFQESAGKATGREKQNLTEIHWCKKDFIKVHQKKMKKKFITLRL